MEDHWLPGFNFNFEEWSEGDRYETLAIDARYQPHARSGPRRIRGCDRPEARRPVHDLQPHARGEAPPGGRLVGGKPIEGVNDD
jgi:hypothetical protein